MMQARWMGGGDGGGFSRRLLALAVLVSFVIPLAPVMPGSAQEGANQDLTGVYTVTVGRPDLPLGLPGGAALLGLWTVAFNGDGSYTLERQDVGRVASGTYETRGSTLVLNDWQGLIGCGMPVEPDTAATYAWRIDETGLTLTPIGESCTDRRLLLATRSFSSYEACATRPLDALPLSVPGTPTPDEATPLAGGGVGAQEGSSLSAEPQEAVDRLLRQATGCWATGNPVRFLPLHSAAVLSELSAIGPLADFAATLQSVMTTPVSFQRIGNLTLVGPTQAWAYVEVTLGGEPLPQRMDFVFEDGAWLFDSFFLFGPAPNEQSAP